MNVAFALPGSMRVLIVAHHVSCNLFLTETLTPAACRCGPTFTVIEVDDENFEGVELLVGDDELRTTRILQARRN